MINVTNTETRDCIHCYREELLIYLVQRFGSLGFAQRVFAETQQRLENCDVLNYVPNPHIYLISYALSLGLEFMQQDMAESRLLPKGQSLSGNNARLQKNIGQNTLLKEELWTPLPASMVR